MKFTDISPAFSGLFAKMTATGLDSSDELATPSGLQFRRFSAARHRPSDAAEQ